MQGRPHTHKGGTEFPVAPGLLLLQQPAPAWGARGGSNLGSQGSQARVTTPGCSLHCCMSPPWGQQPSGVLSHHRQDTFLQLIHLSMTTSVFFILLFSFSYFMYLLQDSTGLKLPRHSMKKKKDNMALFSAGSHSSPSSSALLVWQWNLAASWLGTIRTQIFVSSIMEMSKMQQKYRVSQVRLPMSKMQTKNGVAQVLVPCFTGQWHTQTYGKTGVFFLCQHNIRGWLSHHAFSATCACGYES